MPQRGVQPIWDTSTVYSAIQTFVLAEHRLPTAGDYARQAHGLPASNATMYRYCKDFRQRLAQDNIRYTEMSRVAHNHPWRPLPGRSAVHATTPVD